MWLFNGYAKLHILHSTSIRKYELSYTSANSFAVERENDTVKSTFSSLSIEKSKEDLKFGQRKAKNNTFCGSEKRISSAYLFFLLFVPIVDTKTR